MVDAHALLDAFIGAVILGLEAAAALVILVAGARAIFAYARRLLGRGDARRRGVREAFGGSLLLALDFTIGSDVLKVAQVPDLDRVLVIALVVLVRVVLTFALEYEMKEERRADRSEGRKA